MYMYLCDGAMIECIYMRCMVYDAWAEGLGSKHPQREGGMLSSAMRCDVM